MARKKKPKLKPMRQWTSPIELKLRNAIVESAKPIGVHIYDYSTSPLSSTADIDSYGDVHVTPENFDPSEEEDWLLNDGYAEFGSARAPENTFWLYASTHLLSYKLDFLLVCFHGGVAIECDGHDFHERTKQQASADRARDRELLLSGIPTLRFTGSDIHNYAERCAREVIANAHKWSEDVGRRVPPQFRRYHDYGQDCYFDGRHVGEYGSRGAPFGLLAGVM